MRFGRVLHPEIVLNKRGTKFERDFIKTVLDMTEMLPNGLNWSVKASSDPLNYIIAKALEHDPVFVRFIVSCKIFTERKANVFHIGSDFLQALQKVDRKIPVDILPETFCAYFSFASSTLFDESDAIDGGYVCIDRGRNLGMKAEFSDLKIITFSYVCSKKNPQDPSPPVGSMTVPLDAKTLNELVSGAPVQDFCVDKNKIVDEETLEKRNQVFRALLNCVIYLHSAEPIVQKSVPLEESKKTIKQHKKDGEVINACTIPIHFLWPNYKPIHKIQSTWVDSYPRWQRCGPGLQGVKLVFVSAHERNYKQYNVTL